MPIIVPQANVRGGGAIQAGLNPTQVAQRAKAMIDSNFGITREQADQAIRQNAPNIDRATREVKTDAELLNHLDRVRAYRDAQMTKFLTWLKAEVDARNEKFGELRTYGETRIRNEEDLQRKVAIHMAWQRQRGVVRRPASER